MQAEYNIKSDFETDFFAKRRAIFDVQPVYKLFAKHGVLRYSFVKKLFADYLFCELVL